MFSKVISSAVFGVEGRRIEVEADINDGLPVFSMVGYLSSSVKEAAERVRTALKNSGFHLPPKRITVNLSPADLKKDGSGFDLAIAVAVLLSFGMESVFDLEHTVILGELSLDGGVKGIRGILPMVSYCCEKGIDTCIVPYTNVNEARLIPGLRVIGVKDLEETMSILQGIIEIPDVNEMLCNKNIHKNREVDFSDVKGQETVKRGLEIAVAGFHNVLLTGSAGAGKSMLVKRLPTIMPKMSYEESIEVTKIYSVGGLLLDYDGLITERPFRTPHHTITEKALIGGGAIPRPGEVSFSHNGVLFLDEIPEFNKTVLETLRQPLEDKKVFISRVNGAYIFPADFMLVAASNPCPCGYYPDKSKCKCTTQQIIRYQNKISGPLLDRLDITIDVKAVDPDKMFHSLPCESSKNIQERVERALFLQKNRYKTENIMFNSQLSGNAISQYIVLEDEGTNLLKTTMQSGLLTARGLHRVMKLARSIADLEGSDKVSTKHLQEALFYRNVDRIHS